MQLCDGARTAVPLEDDVLNDSLLVDRTFMIRSDNAVQFSKTIALLGAAGKISSLTNRRQASFPTFSKSFPQTSGKSSSQQTSRPTLPQAARRRWLLVSAYPRVLFRSLVLWTSGRIIVRELF